MNSQFPELAKTGFVYDVSHFRPAKSGRLVLLSREQTHNLIPTGGLNYLQNILFKGTTPAAAWYIGLYEANYTPLAADTMANFPTDATETTTAYDEATREVFTAGTVAGGSVSNAASLAEFTFNAAKTIYGGFMATTSAKSALTGTLLSAVKFASAKTMADEDVLRVTAALTFTSA